MSVDRRLHLARAAEHMVMARLLLLGAEPMLVSVDRGVDLMLPTGTKIQVKAAARPAKHWQYVWKLVQYRYGEKGSPYNNGEPLTAFRSPSIPDFYVLWAVEADRWFVVPAEKVAGKNALYTSRTPRLLEEFENRWDLLVPVEEDE